MGQGNHRKWTPTTQAKELPPLIKNWTTRVNNILHKDPPEEITSFLTCSEVDGSAKSGILTLTW
jgi:hypothetical protein